MSGNGDASFETYRREFMVGLGMQSQLVRRAGESAISFATASSLMSGLIEIRRGLLTSDEQATVPQLVGQAIAKAEFGTAILAGAISDSGPTDQASALDLAEGSQESLSFAFGESTHSEKSVVLALAKHQTDNIVAVITKGDEAHDSLRALTGFATDDQIEDSLGILSMVFGSDVEIKSTADGILNGVNRYLDSFGTRPIDWTDVAT